MNEDKLNILINKFELLYQLNNHSPLFVSIAHKKMLGGDLDECFAIVEKGLNEFSDHPTALLLKSKILIKRGDFPKALKLIKQASGIIGNPKTFDFYLNELEMLNKQTIKVEYEYSSDNSKALSPEEKNIPEKPTELNLNDKTSQKITSPEKDYDVFDDSLIISDTLAKIYFNQKEYKEAIRIYTKLKSKHPEKSDFYDSKISEIKAFLENN